MQNIFDKYIFAIDTSMNYDKQTKYKYIVAMDLRYVKKTPTLNPNKFTCNPKVNPSFSALSALISSNFLSCMLDSIIFNVCIRKIIVCMRKII